MAKVKVKREVILGHKVFFWKDFIGSTRFGIDSPKNYTGDADNLVEARRMAKNLIKKHEVK